MAELALGIVGAAASVDTCIRGGRYLAKLSRDFKHSDQGFSEISVRIEICWARVSAQLESVKKLEPSMTPDQTDLHQRALGILQIKLDAAIMAVSKLDKYAETGTARKARFAMKREGLEGAVEQLEFWQKTSEPTWFHLMKTAPSSMNDTLKDIAKKQSGETATHSARGALKFRQAFEPGKAVFFAESALETYEKTEIPHCPAMLAFDSKEKKHHIIDTVSRDAVKLKDARELAYRFRDSDPLTFGIMRCKGIVRLDNDASLGFIFRVPDGFDEAQSLRQLLQTRGALDALATRLEIARQLATAVYYVHLYDFVHKNICPETTLCLGMADTTKQEHLVCLVGFQVIRNVDGKTNTAKIGDKHRLYCHPSRHGVKTVEYTMQHDIYSLGVCLLEVGLGETLLDCEPDGVAMPSDLLNDNVVQRAVATQDVVSPSPSPNPGGRTIQDQLIALSRGRLKTKMGPKYSKVVETCLTCLDSDNEEFGDARDFQDDDGIEVGARYVQRVIDIMSTISI